MDAYLVLCHHQSLPAAATLADPAPCWQVWQGIAEHLAQATPEVLVLVHPIHLIKDSAKRAVSRQLHRSKSSPQDIMTGVTARQTSRSGLLAELLRQPQHGALRVCAGTDVCDVPPHLPKSMFPLLLSLASVARPAPVLPGLVRVAPARVVADNAGFL